MSRRESPIWKFLGRSVRSVWPSILMARKRTSLIFESEVEQFDSIAKVENEDSNERRPSNSLRTNNSSRITECVVEEFPSVILDIKCILLPIEWYSNESNGCNVEVLEERYMSSYFYRIRNTIERMKISGKSPYIN